MQTATITHASIKPAFREERERTLHSNESLFFLVETAVRNEVKRRQDQAEFLRRGLTAIQRTVAAGDGIPASTVIAKLEAKLAAAKQRA